MHYLARRHLGLSPHEWDSLRWDEHQMYVEGFEAEGLIQRGDSAAPDTPADYGPGDFAAGGISEVTLS